MFRSKITSWLSAVAAVLVIMLNTAPVSAEEDFTVTLGQSKTFTVFNVDRTTGTATSDGQNASAYVQAGPYQSGISQAWAGVSFLVLPGSEGQTVSDAEITLVFDYKISVDFNVLPPTEGGGGSADAWVYGWIANYKKAFDYINFIHYSGNDEKSGTITFTHRLSESPTWTHLYAGQTYEVTADIYTHADVYKNYEALSNGEVTLQEVQISFGCNYSSKPEEPERCFGGIGVRCKGIAGVAPFTKHPNTCFVDGWMSVGSILHDKCCLASNNTGFSCSGINKGNKALCKQEWNEAWYNTQCTQLGAPRQWRHTFGPYPYGNTGDDTNQDLRVPSGRRVNPRYEYLCASGKCEVNSNGKPKIRTDACGKYCKCQ